MPPVVIHDRIERLPISALVPYARNSRTHSDEQLAQIAASMREFGFTNPVLIDEQGGIVAGHGRVMAAQRLGMAHVPCLRLAGLTDAQRRAYVIADNQIALNAGWDDAMLRLELADLQAADFNLDLLGFDADRLDELLADADEDTDETEGLTDDDEVPEAPDHPVTKAGDVWLLGSHRITCGSCRDSKDVKRLLAGVKINLAFTSPPYAAQRTYDESSGFKPIEPDHYVEWYADVAANIHANLADDGSYFCNIKPCQEGLDTHLYVFDLVIAHARRWGFHFATEFCWERVGIPKGVTQRFKNQFEPIYQFVRARWKMRPEAVRHFSKNVPTSLGPGSGNSSWKDDQGSGGAFAKRKRKNGSSQFMSDVQGQNAAPGEFIGEGMAYPGNRLPTFSGSHEATGHTAAFPVGLPEFFIKAYTDEGDAVFDPFMGSGSTLIAAEKNGRIGYGTEISPAYCDVIVRRWQDFTGQQATLEATGQTFDEVSAGA
jgi:hypothetical protein